MITTTHGYDTLRFFVKNCNVGLISGFMLLQLFFPVSSSASLVWRDRLCATEAFNGIWFTNKTGNRTRYTVSASGRWSAGGERNQHGPEGSPYGDVDHPNWLLDSRVKPGALMYRTSYRPNTYIRLPGTISVTLEPSESMNFVMNEYQDSGSFRDNYGCLDIVVRERN
ncbi:MAG: hypothetical protein QNJ42_07460 [Crocosphaera sp.]|nr:hypothetical protein [Crocosphaera sp.]